ncbi:M23 family metallopeptidase [Paenibacillus harenae]|uniref:Stage IV sporulation protein FA n=1 Tax=Paenibacillus harenae TaxID=306543 RepID=A0ABT9TU15_PAEHA|nr:M23 family metallopeptidase [Paenibacillus harenae]MDQ0110842.1 stage IV sporulation protein FA [Paenibacillus harenae]
MNTKDSVKLRRQQKIKQLLEQQPVGQENEVPFYGGGPTDSPLYYEPIDRERADELDPEVAWKTNPNPWASWREDARFGEHKTFIKSSYDPTRHAKSPRKNPFRREFMWKVAIAVLLFGGVWAMFNNDSEWSLQGQAIVKNALTEEIDFAAAAAWYKETFAGAPSFIPIFEDNPDEAIGADGTVRLPVVAPLQDGALVRTFAELLNGVELAGASEETVVAVETGQVILLTDGDDKGASIVIQHANKRVSVYGKLGETTVKADDWVEAGDPIGKLLKSKGTEPSLLYFAVMENDEYVDPLDVIPFD